MTSKKRRRQIRRQKDRMDYYLDYIERNHMMDARPPKFMCTECFTIFAKRYEKTHSNEGLTQKCICGNGDLVALKPEVPIPRKKANNRKWWEFFKSNFMSAKANVYYEGFRRKRSDCV